MVMADGCSLTISHQPFHQPLAITFRSPAFRLQITTRSPLAAAPRYSEHFAFASLTLITIMVMHMT
jgi:hypothetical protein